MSKYSLRFPVDETKVVLCNRGTTSMADVFRAFLDPNIYKQDCAAAPGWDGLYLEVEWHYQRSAEEIQPKRPLVQLLPDLV